MLPFLGSLGHVGAPGDIQQVFVLWIEVLVFHVEHRVEEGAVVKQPVAALELQAAEPIVLVLYLVAFEIEGGFPPIGKSRSISNSWAL